MNKIPCASQNTSAKTLPAVVCVFGCFGRLSPAAVHSADCRFYSEVKWWVHVLSIVTHLRKKPFLLCWNSCKQRTESSTRWCFDRLWANAAPTLNTAFSLTNVHGKWRVPCLLISSTLQFTIDQNEFCFFFLGQLPNLGNLSIQHHLCLYDCV